MSSIEKSLLRHLSQVNYSDDDGPSYQFQSIIKGEELLNIHTPEMKKFLTDAVQKFSTPGGYILDLGCGSGKDSAFFVSKGFKVVSCDLSKGMISMAEKTKANFVEQGRQEFADWEIFECDMTKVKEVIAARPDLPQTYDTAICLCNTIPFLQSMEDISKTFSNISQLLRKGGGLIVDHRNFLPAIRSGRMNKNGHNPCIHDKYNGVSDALVMIIHEPTCPPNPIIAFIEFQQNNGGKVYTTYRILTPESVGSLTKDTFGDDVTITPYYDLKSADSMNIEDACWITYIIEKT